MPTPKSTEIRDLVASGKSVSEARKIIADKEKKNSKKSAKKSSE